MSRRITSARWVHTQFTGRRRVLVMWSVRTNWLERILFAAPAVEQQGSLYESHGDVDWRRVPRYERVEGDELKQLKEAILNLEKIEGFVTS